MSRFRTVELSDPRLETPNRRMLTVHSENLRGRGDIALFIPDGEGLTDLPVVVLLHGVYGSSWVWNLKGGASATAARMIEAGELPPVVLAMPSDGLWRDGSGYLQHHGFDFERWIAEDVPAALRETIPQVGAESAFYLAGLSMGGYGALRVGMRHAAVFSGLSGHSSITSVEDFAGFVPYDVLDYHQTGSASILVTALKNKDHLPPFRFDCGTEDDLLAANRNLHEELVRVGIDHRYEEFPGGHEWAYWEKHLADTLRFFAQLMRKAQ